MKRDNDHPPYREAPIIVDVPEGKTLADVAVELGFKKLNVSPETEQFLNAIFDQLEHSQDTNKTEPQKLHLPSIGVSSAEFLRGLYLHNSSRPHRSHKENGHPRNSPNDQHELLRCRQNDANGKPPHGRGNRS